MKILKIYSSRNVELLSHLPMVEINQDQPNKPIHPVDLVAKTREWILRGEDFASFHEIPFVVAQEMIRKKSVDHRIRFIYVFGIGEEREIHLDVEGEMIEPWPADQWESIFELDFCLRYG